MKRVFVVAAAVFAFAGSSSSAFASQLITRGATQARLAVNARGEALVTYVAQGRVWHVRAWGAVDARAPSESVPQVRFKKDYSGGAWQSFRNACHKYDGPQLAFVVAACGAPDGSYWALQSWHTPLPDLGMIPWLPEQRMTELHLSHWRGPVAKLEVWTDWIYGGRFQHLFGRLTYAGKPVHGFSSTRVGAPLDGYGRLIYLDTFNSKYGNGWRRENSFLAHRPNGIFCYGFYSFDPTKGYPHPNGFPSTPRGPGVGQKYRLTVNGPGVTPDVTVVVPGLHDFDRNNPADLDYERQQNAIQDSVVAGDKQCKQH